MGYELRRWLADRLPAGLSSGERLVALEIADQAREDSRVAYGPKFMETVVRRTGLSSWKQVGKVLGKLSAAGIELRQPITDLDGAPILDKAGRTLFACAGHQTTFRIPDEGECPALKLPSVGDLPAEERSPTEGTNTPERSPAQGTNPEESSPTGETNPPERSPARGQKVPRPGGPTTQTTSVTTTTSPAEAGDTGSATGALFDEPAPAAAAKAPTRRPAASRPAEPVNPDAFADFWKAYPRRTEKRDAVRAWNRALSDGVPPERILQAARHYARERQGEPAKFTKHPATWLNKGCYDDEPASPAGSLSGPPTAPRHLTEEEKRDALQF
ncbi:hypothetical protein [Streptomyces sp. TRM68416]|uniref:hypothetical protein n=1 Tax=Streptomyces sp. TRM68416 TaxID=2758412 RepID=UPI001661F516|nr:hypothetical protein [Streptomyces sp. TRM68416]MBD0838816.1 hypothetical protein [Streptomyces sp. TRM68416]